VKTEITLRGEGWAWVSGELVFLGTFERSLPAPATAANPNTASKSPSVMNNYFSSVLEARGTPIVDSGTYNWVKNIGFNTYDTKTLRWGTNTGADEGLWQVSTYPFGPAPEMNPVCLVLTGKVGAGTLQNMKEFPIDLSPLKPQPLSASSSTENKVDLGNVLIPFNLVPTAPPYSLQEVFSQQSQPTGQLIQLPISYDPCNSKKNADGGKTFYIRVLPMKDGQLLSKPTDTVVFTFSLPPPPPSITYAPTNTFYDIKIVEFTPMFVPDFTYAYCVKVIENPFYKTMLPKWGNAAPGSVVCPTNYQGEGNSNILDDVADFIESAVNFVSDLYNDLSNFVTELVDKLNPFCIQAKFISSAVGEGEEEIKDACHSLAVATVTAVKAYFGLPPSLPNFEELKAMGKDYMVELAADELGVPCPQECKDLIAKGLDYSLEQLKNSSSGHSCMSEDEAHALGFEPLCPPQGVITVPDPRGVPVPPLAVIEVTRHPGSDAENIPQPASCYASLNGTASNDSYVGKTLTLWFGQVYYTWQGTALNAPLVSANASIPSLSSGQSVKIPLVLDPLPYWLPGHYQWYGKWQNVADFDDWHMLYQGANLALTADGDCEFPGYYDSVTTSVEGETKYYGPLGKAYGQTCYPFCP